MEAPGLRGGQPGWVTYAGYRDFLGVATFGWEVGSLAVFAEDSQSTALGWESQEQECLPCWGHD